MACQSMRSVRYSELRRLITSNRSLRDILNSNEPIVTRHRTWLHYNRCRLSPRCPVRPLAAVGLFEEWPHPGAAPWAVCINTEMAHRSLAIIARGSGACLRFNTSGKPRSKKSPRRASTRGRLTSLSFPTFERYQCLW